MSTQQGSSQTLERTRPGERAARAPAPDAGGRGSRGTILLVSYYACMPGACQAEWLDDKIDSLVRAGYRVALVSATCARRHEDGGIVHWRVPSLSKVDYRDELDRTRQRGDRVPAAVQLMWPAVLTLGMVVDWAQRVATGGVGEGRWSWTFAAALGTFAMALRVRPDVILTTGGPASAHLAGLFTGRLLRRPVVVELQDPLSGENIGRNEQSRGWLYRVEKLLVGSATKTVYVTKAAAEFAARQFSASNVQAVYPGARDFGVTRQPRPEGAPFLLVHLGSLYSTRNFRVIIAAIDALVEAGRLQESDIELINLGHVAPEIREEITRRSFVRILSPVSREEALEFAARCDVTLLIQNTDERSRVTIPYKTYDYLNLGNPVLGLLNSDELTELLEACGHAAVPLTDSVRVAEALGRLLSDRKHGAAEPVRIDPVRQALALVDLDATRQPLGRSA